METSLAHVFSCEGDVTYRVHLSREDDVETLLVLGPLTPSSRVARGDGPPAGPRRTPCPRTRLPPRRRGLGTGTPMGCRIPVCGPSRTHPSSAPRHRWCPPTRMSSWRSSLGMGKTRRSFRDGGLGRRRTRMSTCGSNFGTGKTRPSFWERGARAAEDSVEYLEVEFWDGKNSSEFLGTRGSGREALR